ncbi:MAG: AraC family transcriptional regulator [Sphingobacterium sp.]|jgi:AraC family transcriptional regulator|nr:AraC family transcriptional regulator [Sphingobacterium sp.]
MMRIDTKSPLILETGKYIGNEVNQHSFDGIIASDTFYQDDIVSDWHCHQNPHFSHILNGGSIEIRENEKRRQQQGTSLYYYPGIIHQNISYVKGTRIFNLEFTEDFLTKYDLNIPDESYMFSQSALWGTNGLVKIMGEHYLDDQQSILAIQQLSIILLTFSVPIDRIGPLWTSRIKDLLYDHWNSPLSLGFISKELNLHPVTISRYFPQYFGCTIGDYLRRIKIEKALPMIRQKKHSLTEIAVDCGFADQAHFIKTYKRFMGITPKQYQKM